MPFETQETETKEARDARWAEALEDARSILEHWPRLTGFAIEMWTLKALVERIDAGERPEATGEPVK